MTLSRTGESVITASHDKSIRVWTVGDDLIFLEEERERELEEMHEATLAQNLDRDARDEEDQDAEVAAASKQTIATLTHGEKLMEALEVCAEDHELMQRYEADKLRNPNLAFPQRNPVFLALGNISAEQHLLKTLQRIPPPALNDALLVLPFTTLPDLLTFLARFFRARLHPELAWRVTYFLLQAHMAQVVSSGALREPLAQILEAYEEWQTQQRRVLGFNLAGLGIMGVEARENEKSEFVDEAVLEEEDHTKGKKKRAFGNMA